MIADESAKYWIENLDLQKHPEGGYFKEVYRSGLKLNSSSLPYLSEGGRNISTAIYYLLESGDFSSFHRIKSDELWHLYAGSSLSIHIIDNSGTLTTKLLGKNLESDEEPLIVVPKDTWFAAEVNSEHSFSLVGCTVAPGFDFADFEMGNRENLLRTYPVHKDIIERLTR